MPESTSSIARGEIPKVGKARHIRRYHRVDLHQLNLVPGDRRAWHHLAEPRQRVPDTEREPHSWERYGLKPWIEAAARRLHHNVLAIALANKLARIAWSVLHHGRDFEVRRISEPVCQPA